MRTRVIVLFVVLALCSACAPLQRWNYEARSGLIFVGTFVVFYDSEGPLSYQALTPHDILPAMVPVGEVVGDSCQHGLSIPIIFSANDRFSVSGAKGDGSYRKALRNIQEKYPHLAGVYDVKVDVQKWSILTIYRRECTVVAAQGFTHPDSDNLVKVSAQSSPFRE